MIEYKRFEVQDENGEYYGYVDIPTSALENGWRQPKFVCVDRIICEVNDKGIYIRKEDSSSKS